MKLQRERAWEVMEEIVPLLRLHYVEIARYKDIRLNPDFETYIRMEEMGALRVYTMRDDGGFLMGYAIFFVRPNPHYKDSVQAVQDVLYLDPTCRRGLTGVRLIKYADEQLRAEGVQVVMHHVKVYKDFGKILERLGYEAVDTIYAKRLDQVNLKQGARNHGDQRSDRSGSDSGRRGRSGGQETDAEAPVDVQCVE